MITDLFLNNGSEELDIPQPPSILEKPEKVTETMSNLKASMIYHQTILYKKKKAEMYSLWCDALFKLSIANHLRDRVFWFPYNLDFRGRVYPTPPHFNHLGSDVVRGILLFAKGQPLGEKGLDWLKIHLINLTGLKKKNSIEDRLNYANEILPEILDSADEPLNGKKWWMKQEKPWQTLACCMEVAKAVRSPDPATYLCHFPVHQDGSCNGLQHYAALGRDVEGAYQVNLSPSELPQDVYAGVANMVELERVKDALNGNQVAQALEGYVSRKVVKQTVMTIVYGVTRYGAGMQIYEKLKDFKEIDGKMILPASNYLVATTFLSIQKMFSSAKLIQDWFTDCADVICKERGEPVSWVSPLGLPVFQPYTKRMPNNTPATVKGNLVYSRSANPVKQRNAFPPNFIHSLDSCHMMLTSLFCQREGIVFVSVHDCFWTHPNAVDQMNQICRQQFVALHSEPILENLSKHLVQNLAYSNQHLLSKTNCDIAKNKDLNMALVRVPKKGEFNLNCILESSYFFS